MPRLTFFLVFQSFDGEETGYTLEPSTPEFHSHASEQETIWRRPLRLSGPSVELLRSMFQMYSVATLGMGDAIGTLAKDHAPQRTIALLKQALAGTLGRTLADTAAMGALGVLLNAQRATVLEIVTAIYNAIHQ